MSRLPFEGIHILDFTWFAVGPVTTKYLADYGADVVRIESAARLDGLRLAPPWKDAQPGPNNSQFFASFNSSKRGLALDMSKPRAREIFLKMLPWADVVTESFTPKTLRNWGLDYDSMRAIKPDLIMLSTCMQGQTGPHRDYPGFGNLMAALSGFYYISGYSEAEPCPPYGAYTDFIAPRFSACALIGALDHRRRTGKGQYIDMAQYEAALHNLAPVLLDYFATGRVQGPGGNRSERYAPHGAYRCADEDGHERWIAIAVADDNEWRALLQVLGNPPATRASPPCADAFTIERRSMNLIGHSCAHAQRRGADRRAAGRRRISAYPVQNCMDLHRDENLEEFGFWQWLDHKEMGPSPYEGLEHRMSRTPGARRAAPVLGQHSEEVFTKSSG